MSADFTPTLHSYTERGAFRYWVQKVLPLVYDDSLSYYELLNKVVMYLNNLIGDCNDLIDDVTALRDAFVELQDYVNEYFDNLDLSSEVEAILDEMVVDGTIPGLLDDWLDDNASASITAWLNAHPEATTTVQDGSITNAKLVQSGGILSDVDGLKQALDYVIAVNITHPYNAEVGLYSGIENYIEKNLHPLPNVVTPVALPSSGSFPVGANHVFVFGCKLSAISGNNITSCNMSASLVNNDENVTIDCETVDIYHWTGDEDNTPVFFRFDVLGVFPVTEDNWHIELNISDVVDGPGGYNNLNFEISNPYFVDYTGLLVQEISDWFASHWTPEFTDCKRVWDIEQAIEGINDTIATLQLEAMPQLSSSDIATIISNVN